MAPGNIRFTGFPVAPVSPLKRIGVGFNILTGKRANGRNGQPASASSRIHRSRIGSALQATDQFHPESHRVLCSEATVPSKILTATW